jgi:putative tryptophan/tyrosine transport system substrate-binding protein
MRPTQPMRWPGKRRINAARVLAVTLQSYEVRNVNDFEGAFARIAQQRPDFLYVLQDALMLGHRRQIIDSADQNRLPSVFVGKEWVEEGGLMCCGVRLPQWYRRAASYVDKILRGAKPADLQTAKTIGVTIPPELISRADEVIE